MHAPGSPLPPSPTHCPRSPFTAVLGKRLSFRRHLVKNSGTCRQTKYSWGIGTLPLIEQKLFHENAFRKRDPGCDAAAYSCGRSDDGSKHTANATAWGLPGKITHGSSIIAQRHDSIHCSLLKLHCYIFGFVNKYLSGQFEIWR